VTKIGNFNEGWDGYTTKAFGTGKWVVVLDVNFDNALVKRMVVSTYCDHCGAISKHDNTRYDNILVSMMTSIAMHKKVAGSGVAVQGHTDINI